MHCTDKTFFRTHQLLIPKECHLFSIKLVLFQFGRHSNHETPLIVFPICLTDRVKSFITLVSQITEIWQIWKIVEMINCDVTNSIAPHFYADIDVFSSQSLILELHISKTAWRILIIHISIFSIFKALPSKSNSYFACSSPLSE